MHLISNKQTKNRIAYNEMIPNDLISHNKSCTRISMQHVLLSKFDRMFYYYVKRKPQRMLRAVLGFGLVSFKISRFHVGSMRVSA